MFSNVVIGVDGHSGGRDAIALARRLADPGARFTVAHVSIGMVPLVPSVLVWDEAEEDRAVGVVRDAVATMAGLDAHGAVTRAPSPGEGLHRLVADVDADLLVVGSSHHGAVGRVVLGDGAHEALEGAPGAIAVAPRGFAEHDAPLAHVGVGYDASDESVQALYAARAIAGRAGGTVEALAAIHVPAFPPGAALGWAQALPEIRAHVERDLASLEGAEGHAVVGPPDTELAALSERVDLLVVGSRRYGPVRRLFLGSTASHLAHHAASPLLVLPRGTTAEEPRHELVELPAART